MLYSHIYKMRPTTSRLLNLPNGHTLILTTGAEINTGVIRTEHHADKRSAKAAAKAANATPWNY